eukprot:TRINITY_DN3789_c0_g1_i1.p2 TRINITY_DN3789_c0_g1~~TRINITY_DN3789_c0_g1_i1.p2  ORF type:complete len:165 (-),score=13.36 TRINITY_DN3789_c0_g1_i1:825-1319(-)
MDSPATQCKPVGQLTKLKSDSFLYLNARPNISPSPSFESLPSYIIREEMSMTDTVMPLPPMSFEHPLIEACLPSELLGRIFLLLDAPSLRVCSEACLWWYLVAQGDYIWKSLYTHYYSDSVLLLQGSDNNSGVFERELNVKYKRLFIERYPYAFKHHEYYRLDS